MSNPTDIEAALRQAFLVAIPAASGKTAFENQAFKPAGKSKWFIFHFMPNPPVPASLGPGGSDEFTGICQIDINVAPDTGKATIDADYSSLRSVFTTGAKLSYSSSAVKINSCGKSGAGKLIDGFFRVSVSIAWESRIPR